MANIIAVVNQKGGVGKTTTTVNITAALRALGKRVLLCDFDAQANATSGMGVDKNTASPNVYDVLINGAEPQKAVVSTKYGDVLPSNKAWPGWQHRNDRHSRPGAPVAEGPGAAGTQLRLHLHRLPPLSGDAYRQRPVRRRLPAGPGAVRVVRPGGPQRPAGHGAAGQAGTQPQAVH